MGDQLSTRDVRQPQLRKVDAVPIRVDVALVVRLEEVGQRYLGASGSHRLGWIEVLRDVCIQCRDRLAGLIDGHIRVATDLDPLRLALDASVQQEALPAGLADTDCESFGVIVVKIGQADGWEWQSVGLLLRELDAIAGGRLVFLDTANLATWWLRTPRFL